MVVSQNRKGRCILGSSHWSDDAYAVKNAVRSSRISAGGAAFAYTDAVLTGKAPKVVNPLMSPSKVASARSPFVGKVVRESRDSDLHPTSLAIGVVFDVTGSMKEIPVTLEKKLAGLMALLTQKGYVAHPQILFGAIGDAYSDSVPLQIGEFESGAEMDDDLDKIYLEGNGGGQHSETYELAHYFFLHHTATDCWEKRQHKGYFFTMGDEACYDYVRKTHVKDLIGDTLQADVPTAEVIQALEERYHVFHIIIEQGSYPHNPTIEGVWTKLLGERVLKLEDADNVAELIALTIGLTEGTVDIDAAAAHLKDVGLGSKAITTVTKALVPLAKSAALTKPSTVTGDLVEAGGGGVERV